MCQIMCQNMCQNMCQSMCRICFSVDSTYLFRNFVQIFVIEIYGFTGAIKQKLKYTEKISTVSVQERHA